MHAHWEGQQLKMFASVGGTGNAGLQIIIMPLLHSVPEKEQQL